MSSTERIFCCEHAVPVAPSYGWKLHKDPNREIHDAIFISFMNFAVRRQNCAMMMEFIRGHTPASSISSSSSSSTTSIQQQSPVTVLTAETLLNNPVRSDTPYIIHLTSRLDFGPVLSHRYFVCPSSLKEDWVEVSLGQWFAAGEPFKLRAEKWDVKCVGDSKFFRLTLRPNLSMRFPPFEDQVASGI